MANRKITELSALTGANANDSDVFPIVDVSADETKKMTLGELKEAFDAGSGFVRVTGDTMTGDLSFGDNDKAIFGAGSDLQIYHQTTGTAGSYIAENGTGDLRISGNNLWLNDVSGDTYFRAVNGSYAKLYHAGAEKISTTSTGVDVTGTITSDGLTVDSSTALIQAEQEGGIGATLVLKNTSNTNATGNGSRLKFVGGNNNGRSAYIETRSTGTFGRNPDTVFGSEGDGGGDVDHMRIASDGDISFYEDTGTTAKFFWDASAESLGIGTSSPISAIDVRGEAVFGSGTDGVKLTYSAGNSTGIIDTGFTSTGLEFRTGNSFAAIIDSSGNVGIGTGSPAHKLHLNGAAENVHLMLSNSTTGSTNNDGLHLITETGTGNAYIIQRENADLITYTNNQEAMRIDSSGNLLVGKTSTSSSVAGHRFSPLGKIQSTLTSDTHLLNRLSSNGSILSFAKDGSTVGSIGYESSGLYIDGESGHAGLSFGGNSVVPRDGGARLDNVVDVGSATYRFKDLYLSGQVVNPSGDLAIGSTSASHDTLLSSARNTRFVNASSERMRIDSSGNLLVGTTNTSPATNNVDGAVLRSEGHINVSRSGGVVGYFNRRTSDGTILDLRKDGSTVGSITAGAGGFLTIGSPNGTPVYATFANGALKPTTSLGANSDGSGDLGNTSSRWKDLYLSGGVYLGGTGSANKLDDYEEGTFTPTVSNEYGNVPTSSATTSGHYTKVGRLVTAVFTIDYSDSGAAVALHDRISLSGLPFVGLDYFNGTGQAFQYGVISSGNNAFWTVVTTTSSSFYVYCIEEDGSVQYDEGIRGTVTYRTS